ncbi:hypothetical protein [Shewanella sp. GXUN23E]|uniref:hypothetical protein n=1 Tax=Shewanella sp. GXUN23E TaxID=3422498 RepID=UPI003D7D92A8
MTSPSNKHAPKGAEVRYWQQFQQALVRHADKGDLDALRAVNRKLVNALIQRGAPQSHAELVARQELAQCHQAIIQRLKQDKDELARSMQAFRANQDGLAAYELTALSSVPILSSKAALSLETALSAGASQKVALSTGTSTAAEPAQQPASAPHQQGYPSPYGD